MKRNFSKRNRRIRYKLYGPSKIACYPWEDWIDQHTVRLYRGLHFKSSCDSFAKRARDYIWQSKKGLSLHIYIDYNEETVTLYYRKRLKNANKSN